MPAHVNGTERMSKDNLPKTRDISQFLAHLDKLPVRAHSGGARLLFALDATASRQPTWDTACALQSRMFAAATAGKQLQVRLCYYRSLDEFRATPWLQDSAALLSAMNRVRCLGGHTQIARLLRFMRQALSEQPIQAAVFIGDALEESPDEVCQLAGELGVLGLPLFIFQEGDDPLVTDTFQQMARLSRGAWARFDAGSADTLRALLEAVAAYASGGTTALEALGHRAARALLTQLPGGARA